VTTVYSYRLSHCHNCKASHFLYYYTSPVADRYICQTFPKREDQFMFNTICEFYVTIWPFAKTVLRLLRWQGNRQHPSYPRTAWAIPLSCCSSAPAAIFACALSSFSEPKYLTAGLRIFLLLSAQLRPRSPAQARSWRRKRGSPWGPRDPPRSSVSLSPSPPSLLANRFL
jgi:hypothetical protein